MSPEARGVTLGKVRGRGDKADGASAVGFYLDTPIDKEGTVRGFGLEGGVVKVEKHLRTDPEAASGVGVKGEAKLLSGEGKLTASSQKLTVEAGAKAAVGEGSVEMELRMPFFNTRIKVTGTLLSAGAEAALGKKTKIGLHMGAGGGSLEIEFSEGAYPRFMRELVREGAQGYRTSRTNPHSQGAMIREELGRKWP